MIFCFSVALYNPLLHFWFNFILCLFSCFSWRYINCVYLLKAPFLYINYLLYYCFQFYFSYFPASSNCFFTFVRFNINVFLILLIIYVAKTHAQVVNLSFCVLVYALLLKIFLTMFLCCIPCFDRVCFNSYSFQDVFISFFILHWPIVHSEPCPSV